MNKFNNFHTALYFFFFFLLLCKISFSQTLCPSGTTCYNIAAGSSQTINLFGECAIVNNTNSAPKDLHVPTNTFTEWSNFLAASQAGTVSGVTLSCCSNNTPFTSNGSFTLPYGCTTMTVEAWGGGGGGDFKVNGSIAKPGGSGGYAKLNMTGLTPRTTYTVTVGTGGTCNITAGTGGYAGGAGGVGGGTCGVGGAGSGSATGGNGGTKVGASCNGGAGKFGGGGGGGATSKPGAGGGGATVFKLGAQDYVVAGGGGGAGMADAPTSAGAGGAACGNGATGKGGNGTSGDNAGGGGGGACACWNGTTLASANCTSTANGTGATAPTPNPGAGYVIGGPLGNTSCSGTTNDGSPGYLKVTYP